MTISDQTRRLSCLELGFVYQEVTLSGTLYVPDAPPPHPAVVMLPGSGPADRDADGYFPPLRQAFVRRGIAVYSYDKPGIGASSDDWRAFGLSGRAGQVHAALEMLRHHVAIDAARVGVFGHSQGGWVVQLVASQTSQLAFAITSAGPGVSLPEQDLYGIEHSLRAAGKPDVEIARAVAFTRALHAAARRGDDFPTICGALLASARDESYSGYHELHDAADWAMLRRFITEPYEPAAALARIQCPLLAVFGELDPQVPVQASVATYGQALRAAGNLDVTLVVFPHANHRMLLPDSAAFAPGYLDLVADWAAHRVQPGSGSTGQAC